MIWWRKKKKKKKISTLFRWGRRQWSGTGRRWVHKYRQRVPAVRASLTLGAGSYKARSDWLTPGSSKSIVCFCGCFPAGAPLGLEFAVQFAGSLRVFVYRRVGRGYHHTATTADSRKKKKKGAPTLRSGRREVLTVDSPGAKAVNEAAIHAETSTNKWSSRWLQGQKSPQRKKRSYCWELTATCDGRFGWQSVNQVDLSIVCFRRHFHGLVQKFGRHLTDCICRLLQPRLDREVRLSTDFCVFFSERVCLFTSAVSWLGVP